MLKTRYHASGSTTQVHLGGWRKQPHDARDEAFKLKLPPGFAAVPTSLDLRPLCPPVDDQGQLGSCTANMLAGMVEFNEHIATAKAAATAAVTVSGITVAADGSITYTTKVVPPAPAPTPNPTPTPTPSPKKLIHASRLFSYYATRKIEGTTGEDSGATIRDTVKSGALYGLVDEALYPYDITKFAVNPPATIWTAAATHKVTSYHSINDGDIATMKAALVGGNLVGYGFQVYDYFLSAAMAKQGFLDLPGPSEQLQGGHAQALVGYDDKKVSPFNPAHIGAFLVRNSWGTDWCLGGYYWISYEYIKNTALASDFWVVQSAPL